MHANNVIGTVQPSRDRQIACEKGIYSNTDADQTFGT